MSAAIIPFPADRVYRHPDLIDALEHLEMCDAYEVSGDNIKRAVSESPIHKFLKHSSTLRLFW